MINFRKKEKGISLVPLIGFFIVGGIVLIYGSQIGIAYMNKSTVHSAVKAILAESRSNDNATPATIKSAIFKKISMSDIDSFGNDDVVVSKKSGGYSVDVKMEKTIEISENISILVNFEFYPLL